MKKKSIKLAYLFQSNQQTERKNQNINIYIERGNFTMGSSHIKKTIKGYYIND